MSRLRSDSVKRFTRLVISLATTGGLSALNPGLMSTTSLRTAQFSLGRDYHCFLIDQKAAEMIKLTAADGLSLKEIFCI